MATPVSSLVAIADRAARPHPGLAWPARLALLRAELSRLERVVVAYSGGVDSSLLLRVAHEALGARALGVIGRSDSYAARELELALAQAAAFGARIEVVTTGELADPDFAANPATRCYHCKQALYARLEEVAARLGGATILDGTIADDLADWRPGRRAAAEHAVRSPLAELGFGKADVRAAAEHYGLASAGKPASPCLASRIPYGTRITREVLSRVERGEALLAAEGFRELRLRHHGDVARIEVPAAELARLLEPGLRARVVAGLKALGYAYVTLDLEGFRSGSLNAALASPAAAVDISGTASGEPR
ncbi:MAG TPA: ATP-dependent sacrificial sulfur transferase LarE [Candidatus Eisenbacteria bacterium]|nr:ATP-dependent sacrificial sulfur transferase LarE [Candidatus Eisenbacteria bacterium]